MNCVVSSIQPESSTAPACRNISQGERACAGAGRQRRRARALERQEAAARDIGDPLDHAGAGPVDQQNLAHHAGGGARHQRGKRGDGGLFDAFGRDNDAQHGGLRCLEVKTPHCYHLVTIKSARRLQLFAAGEPPAWRGDGRSAVDRQLNVLDLFSSRAMFAAMSRASSHALKHPPVTAPSEPAGALSPFPELAVAIERGRRRGRGAQSNASGRFEAEARVAFDDGWQSLDELPPFKTTVALDTARKVITRNNSPDIGFDRSINPYRGCEHGCVYCFARPTHAYLGLSPGLDFESKLFAKPDAPQLLEKELAAQDYEPRMIAIGTNTDPYQPIERERKIMRGILEVLDRAGHPVGIVTKSALVTRDIDILARMAKRNLAKVAISVTTLDAKLARTMEPRASTPSRRLEALRQLSEAGIPTTVMVAPVIPALNDARSSAFSTPRPMPASRKRAMCCCGCRWRCATCFANG